MPNRQNHTNKPGLNKRKTNTRTPKSSRSGGKSGSLISSLFSTPFRQIIITVIAVILMVVFWDEVTDFGEMLLEQLGWGLAFILVFLITVVVIILLHQGKTFFHHWYRWLGLIGIIVLIWGIMATVPHRSTTFPSGLGGEFGRTIVSFPGTGILYFFRLLVIGILSIIFMFPRNVFAGIKNSASWMRDQFNGPAKSRKETVKNVTEVPPHRELQTPVKKEYPQVTIEKDNITADTSRGIDPAVLDSQKKLEALALRAEALRPGADVVTDKIIKEKLATGKSDSSRQTAMDVKENFVDQDNLVIMDGWSLPPVDILDATPEMQFSQADNAQRAQLIEETLASYGVDAKVVQINAGPTVTQFGVEPGWDRRFKEFREKDDDGKVRTYKKEISKTRVKVEKISSLSNDLSLALAAPSIRIEAPVPGKTYVGVEVPNVTSDMVSLRSVIESLNFQKLSAKTAMAIALGKGAGGESVSADLTKMPHLLIAGSTGSGKTVCLNTIICGLLMYNTPADLRFILIDPKRVELTQYNSIPHLATPVIVETPKALAALRWLCQEMDKRYQTFSKIGARNIESYNKKKEGIEKLPYLVLIIDELADLMMAGFDEVETNLCRLAQLARATGIHLVVATQRPSVDVVTGLIKANFPTRLSFAVTSQIDSRTILDSPGAEKLLGHGDMLYLPTDAAKPKRLQGCFLSDAEIDRLVYFWGSQRGDRVDPLKMETLVATTPEGTIGGHPRDSLLEQAKELAKNYSDVSTSFLQRKLHIGYPRAARLKEQLDAVLEKEAKDENEEEDILDIPVEDDTNEEY